jgi:hypothetical protein
MSNQWLAMEHYRLHQVEQWPESRKKCATLAAIRSTMGSLSPETGPLPGHGDCLICLGRMKKNTVYEIRNPMLTPPCDVRAA